MCAHLQGSSVTLEVPFLPLAPLAWCDPQQGVLSPALGCGGQGACGFTPLMGIDGICLIVLSPAAGPGIAPRLRQQHVAVSPVSPQPVPSRQNGTAEGSPFRTSLSAVLPFASPGQRLFPEYCKIST